MSYWKKTKEKLYLLPLYWEAEIILVLPLLESSRPGLDVWLEVREGGFPGAQW